MLRKQGWTAEVVERFVPAPHLPGGGHRKDYLGIIDIIALAGPFTFGVQSCGEAFSEHAHKILESDGALAWLESPHRGLVLVGWRKIAAYRKDGTRASRDRIAPRVQWFRLIDGKVQAMPEQDEL